MGRRENRRRKKLESASEIGADAVVKLVDSATCEKYGEVFFEPMTLQIETQLSYDALKYYRKDVYSARIATLEVRLESEMIDKDTFDLLMDEAGDEITSITIDDMPPKDIQYRDSKTGEHQTKTIDFTTWFMAATQEGQIAAVSYCKKDRPDITRQGLMEVYEREPEFFIVAATAIQQISESRIAKK